MSAAVTQPARGLTLLLLEGDRAGFESDGHVFEHEFGNVLLLSDSTDIVCRKSEAEVILRQPDGVRAEPDRSPVEPVRRLSAAGHAPHKRHGREKSSVPTAIHPPSWRT